MKKIIMVVLIMALTLSLFTGCEERQSDIASRNISLEADNFNVVRQLTVINCIQGDTLFQMTGKLSIEADILDNQLEVTVEDEYGRYQKHFVGLSDNVTYVVEDLRASDVNNYKYTLNYNPKMWLPVELKIVD